MATAPGAYIGDLISYLGWSSRTERMLDPVFIGLDSGVYIVKTHYRMRAFADPGPGYEFWSVDDAPDFLGTYASGPIIAGSAVAIFSWVL